MKEQRSKDPSQDTKRSIGARLRLVRHRHAPVPRERIHRLNFDSGPSRRAQLNCGHANDRRRRAALGTGAMTDGTLHRERSKVNRAKRCQS
jgi:hypothetical protein